MRKNKKTAVKAAIVYIVTTVGMWMFLYSYANSYNKLTEEKIVPAVLTVGEDSAELELIGSRFRFSSSAISPDSKGWFAAYLFLPIEVRGIIKIWFNKKIPAEKFSGDIIS